MAQTAVQALALITLTARSAPGVLTKKSVVLLFVLWSCGHFKLALHSIPLLLRTRREVLTKQFEAIKNTC